MRKNIRLNETKRLIIPALCAAIAIYFCFHPELSLAGEAYKDTARSLKIEEHTLWNVQLTNIKEDNIFINGKRYVFTDHSKFKKEADSGTYDIKLNEITPPCLADITFKTFSVYTEAMPYNPDDRLLVEVIVKKTPEHIKNGNKERRR